MDQTTLVRELYRACVARDAARQRELLREGIAMVLKHRAEGKRFDSTWTVVGGW